MGLLPLDQDHFSKPQYVVAITAPEKGTERIAYKPKHHEVVIKVSSDKFPVDALPFQEIKVPSKLGIQSNWRGHGMILRYKGHITGVDPKDSSTFTTRGKLNCTPTGECEAMRSIEVIGDVD